MLASTRDLVINASGRLTAADPGVSPQWGGLPGKELLLKIVGTLLNFGLILGVGGVVAGAVMWVVGSLGSNPHTGSRGKSTVVIALGASLVIAGANALVGFFSGLGATI